MIISCNLLGRCLIFHFWWWPREIMFNSVTVQCICYSKIDYAFLNMRYSSALCTVSVSGGTIYYQPRIREQGNGERLSFTKKMYFCCLSLPNNSSLFKVWTKVLYPYQILHIKVIKCYFFLGFFLYFGYKIHSKNHQNLDRSFNVSDDFSIITCVTVLWWGLF